LFPKRKQSASQLVLPKGKQKIALIFARVASAFEQDAVGREGPFQPGEVAGRDVLGPKLVSAINETAEFEVSGCT